MKTKDPNFKKRLRNSPKVFIFVLVILYLFISILMLDYLFFLHNFESRAILIMPTLLITIYYIMIPND